MKQLLSVGLDVGTTSTQMVVSRLGVENRGNAFTVPQMVIGSREIIYESPVYFTPLSDESHIDMDALMAIVRREYAAAGITPQNVDTGAVIITGETARRENADAVLHALSDMGGDFVVATAGPDLESVLAAKGAGAVAESERCGKTVLHFDIGGGTANMALIENGSITATGCLNVGGRLVKTEQGRITYLSPVLSGLTTLHVGDTADPEEMREIVEILVKSLETAAGLREDFTIPASLVTNRLIDLQSGNITVSFSGGVADCIAEDISDDAFGDIGPMLGRAIRGSKLCAGDYFLGTATIRATVIGAGSYSTALSGSTVHYDDAQLPIKNLPAAVFSAAEQLLPEGKLTACIRERCSTWEEPVMLFFPGFRASYPEITRLASAIAGAKLPFVGIAVESDMAKSLGQALRNLGVKGLCIDGIRLQPGDYIDVGCPVGGAVPVVIKTLILSQ